ncbi:TM0106 family RecB-like putative nuclease [Spirulina subsalsa FACHB-351]|uniref:TM0106 family RecB-like putative nuclease n=1 Tax=Spirulina subsalsa FACHB-351 TaxID=234711 RepID=A0ABT3L7D5_9CYAN|nr:TM0106 family RecB-like putative nuclease [Spirulina subsalsa]MCW6037092.1 TM0106 family RecB-like putative nuclease [Spirulina subsalsa FACHB-351]
MLLNDELLLDYRRCERRSYLNVYGDISQREPERDFVLKLRKENRLQVMEFLAGREHCTPDFPSSDWQLGAKQTAEWMAEGVNLIERGVLLLHEPISGVLAELNPEGERDWDEETLGESVFFVGRPTLLVKQPGQSRWGDWSYTPVNIRLGKRAKPEYKIISAFHAYLLERLQGEKPLETQLILRDLDYCGVDLTVWFPRLAETLAGCWQMLEEKREPEVFISRQRCGLCHWHSYCHAIAQTQQHLSLVPGVTPSRYEELQQLGVNSLEKLAHFTLPEVTEHIDFTVGEQLQLQALALWEKRAILLPQAPYHFKQQLPQNTIELYFDIEAEPERNVDYLLGVLYVNHTTQTQKFYTFLAEQPEDEPFIWHQCLALFERYPQAPIFHFADYEVDTVKRLSRSYGIPSQPWRQFLQRFVDIHHWVTASVVAPVESYSLKSLAKWLGFEWRDPDMSGDQTVCWYDQWLQKGDRHYLDAIVRYNEDDCRATYHLKMWLQEFLNSQGS